MTGYLFVYGTLRKELVARTTPELAAMMQSLPFIGYGQIQGQLYDLGEFPGAILGDNFPTKIYGEIYELPNPQEFLEALDVYEGFIPGELEASLFARVKEKIISTNGEEFSCWLYVYNDWVLNGTLIENGDYLIWKSREK